MKKHISWLVIALVTFSLLAASCQRTDTPSAETSSQTTDRETASTTAAEASAPSGTLSEEKTDRTVPNGSTSTRAGSATTAKTDTYEGSSTMTTSNTSKTASTTKKYPVQSLEAQYQRGLLDAGNPDRLLKAMRKAQTARW